MKERCNNPKRHNYQNYGGKGIIVCSEWNKFDNFYKWAIENGYEKGLSIERIDTDGNYCPENCKCVHKSEQTKNTRRVNLIEYNGSKYCLTELCKILNLPYSTMRHRVYDLNIPF